MYKLPLVSIIVATYRRERVLRRTLGHLHRLSYPNYEVLVIDQTPEHEQDTERYLQELAKRSPGRFLLYRLSRPGLPYARNVGAVLATGTYLLYCDDDIIPPTNLIELHLANLEMPGVGAVTGGIRVEQPKQPPQLSACVVEPNGRMHQYWDFEVPRGTTDSLIGCNMSISRTLAIRLGLFDDGYIGRANWEETDLSMRIRRCGYKIMYEPDAAVVHLAHPEGGVRTSRDVDMKRYYYESHYNNAYFFAKNIQQRYIPWMLKRELGWILIKQAVLQGHRERTGPSLRGVWDGYLAGRRTRQRELQPNRERNEG